MPRLVKGAKWTFGWVVVGPKREIAIPPEAFAEYGLAAGEKGILMPGSKTSGGFGLATEGTLEGSRISDMLKECPEISKFQAPEGAAIAFRGKTYCWVELHEGHIVVPPDTLKSYGAKPDDRLLAARGSGLALGFLVRGPIAEEAQRHPEVEVFASDNKDVKQ